MNEVALVTINNHILYKNVGTSGSVDFEFLPIWKVIKEINNVCYLKEEVEEELTFWHTHPTGCNDFSFIDQNCLHALYLGLGFKKINFNLVIFESEKILASHFCKILKGIYFTETSKFEVNDEIIYPGKYDLILSILRYETIRENYRNE